jgi:rfaE bifunctional protein kinase chain/domain
MINIFMDFREIDSFFEKIKQYNILIIGDLMIDSYLWGEVSRISPEAPVPIVDCKKREHRLGGAANVALNVKSLGANPILCAVTGNDDKAEIIKELLKNHELTDIGIISDSERMTTIKFRVIAFEQQMLRVDEENTNYLSPEIENNFIANIVDIINKTTIHAVIFEDYDKGTITPKVISAIVNLCNNKNIPTLVDPKKRNFFEYKNVTLFKPNFKELIEGLKVDAKKEDFETIFQISRRFIEKTNIQYIMTTLSELGIIICDSEKYFQIPAEQRDISDVSGAGDTVIAVAALCRAAGFSVSQIAEISNLAGGLVCEKVGVVPVKPKTLKEEMKLKALKN